MLESIPKVVSAATAASAVGFFMIPASFIPLAHAACDDWTLGPANLILHQDNGIEVDVYGWSGKAITALPSGKPAYAQYWSNNTKTTGSATGHLNGKVVEMNLTWGDGPGAGGSNYYYATIADDGTVFGTTTNNLNVSNGFNSETKAKCNTAPAKPADAGAANNLPPDKPALPAGTVNATVDIYDSPAATPSARSSVKWIRAMR